MQVGLVLVTGNSHAVGRDSASGDVFAAKVSQWTQAGAIAAPAAGMLDFGDTASGFSPSDITPMLSLLNALAAARADLPEIVVVPNGQGSTGFSDATWTSGGSRLPGAVARWNAAKAAIEARGDTVVPLCAIHLSSNPDVAGVVAASGNELVTAHVYSDNQDAYVDYLRANLSGVDPASFPVIVGCAMTASEISGAGTNAPVGIAVGNGIAFRRRNTWFMDPVNDRGDGEAANLPIAPFDGIHANRLGELTKGRLLYAGLARAAANAAPNAPFSGFASWADIASLYDFRSGGGKDQGPGGYHLTQPHSNPPLIRFASAFGTFVYDRPTGTGRTFERPRYLPAQYTIVTRVSFDSLSSAQGILMNALGVSAVQQRFFISSSGNIVAGNAGGSQVSVAHGLSINTIYTLAATYDGTSIRVYRNGTLLATAAAPAPDQTQNLYLGAQGSASTGPLLGDMQWLAVYSRALNAGEISELTTAEYHRPPVTISSGQASGLAGVTGAAVAAAPAMGQATGIAGVAGAATASAPAKGEASGLAGVTGAASAQAPARGQASGEAGVTGAATAGQGAASSATASGEAGVTGAATATAPVRAQAAGVAGVAGAAEAAAPARGTAAGVAGVTGEASGMAPAKAIAGGIAGVTGEAIATSGGTSPPGPETWDWITLPARWEAITIPAHWAQITIAAHWSEP